MQDPSLQPGAAVQLCARKSAGELGRRVFPSKGIGESPLHNFTPGKDCLGSARGAGSNFPYLLCCAELVRPHCPKHIIATFSPPRKPKRQVLFLKPNLLSQGRRWSLLDIQNNAASERQHKQREKSMLWRRGHSNTSLNQRDKHGFFTTDCSQHRYKSRWDVCAN